jgi:NDP-mannose synthase
MKAVILAGGKGLRLRPYTSVLPKPLMPIGDRPILEIILRQLARDGVTEVVLALGYLGDLIRTYLEQTDIPTLMKLRYHWEDEPLGTAGAVGSIQGLDEPFLVMNGDLLTSLDFAAMYREHMERGTELTVGVVRTKVKIELGVLALDGERRITGYDEKPTLSYAASMGIYVYSPSVRDLIPPGVYLDAPTLVTTMIGQGRAVRGHDPDCIWIDMGNSGEHERASELFVKDPSVFMRSAPMGPSGPIARAAVMATT